MSNNNSKSSIYFNETEELKKKLLKTKESNNALNKRVSTLNSKISELKQENNYYENTLNRYKNNKKN